ncbi:hypothetical protein ACFU93_44190 [Streptomyces sp. NPDC057611]|uniref:hypothetical protein n=1 Tax=Streptomyces sp. NPDC057611 TaxID=3346182 RepID=UPI0036B3AB9D
MADEDDVPGYSRAKFPHWITQYGTCDTREVTLQRDGQDDQWQGEVGDHGTDPDGLRNNGDSREQPFSRVAASCPPTIHFTRGSPVNTTFFSPGTGLPGQRRTPVPRRCHR